MATVAPSEEDRRVRIVAKIRGLKDQESASATAIPWFSVHKPQGDATQTVNIAFGDASAPSSRGDCCVVDSCYLSDQDSHSIFSREVEPLISSLFDARNVTLIACGARGSGKTYLFQGTDDAPGLAPLAMAQLLSLAEQRSMLVAMSLYEIDQDHVYDLLHPQRHKIIPCKDAKGNIQLKGLSRVRVTSIPEFLELYCVEQISCKTTTQKMANPLHRRTHKGLMVHVSSRGQKSDIPVGKMNFVDLAGYEDVRRKNGDEVNFIENTKINKSIYALHNVIYSLNTNEAHIPYRESKLTHMLEDSLGGRSKILMITCLNPFFCQDSIYMMTLASRSCSCRGNDRNFSKSTNKTGGSAHQSRISRSASNNIKTMPRVFLSRKKPNSTHSWLEARKLFDEKSGLQNEKASAADVDISPLAKEASSICDPKTDTKMNFTVSTHDTREISLAVPKAQQTIISYQDLYSEDNCEGVMQRDSIMSVVRNDMEEETENNNSLVNENGSPPISARLQEISNNLKLLLRSSTQAVVGLTPERCTTHGQTSADVLEPRTPNITMTMKDGEISSFHSPWETFSISSSTVKDRIVNEYLRFLNTATKEELKKLKGIGEKRATYILKLRETSPMCFKDLDDLKDIGLSAKQNSGSKTKEAVRQCGNQYIVMSLASDIRYFITAMYVLSFLDHIHTPSNTF